MKKNILATLLLTVFFTTVLLLTSVLTPIGKTTAYAFSTGSPGGRTGSPTDYLSCTQCHTGSPINSGSAIVTISSTALSNGYVPGQTYTIDVDVTNTSSNKIGFEVTAEKKSDNTKIGTIVLTNVSRTDTTNSQQAITHTSAGNVASNGNNSWSFDWTAPQTGTDTVVFYGAFNVANGNGTTTGDKIYTTTFTVTEITTSINELNDANNIDIYPNPAKDFVVINSIATIKKIELFNINGDIISTDIFINKKIDTSTFPNGIYFLKAILEDGNITTKKILIAR